MHAKMAKKNGCALCGSLQFLMVLWPPFAAHGHSSGSKVGIAPCGLDGVHEVVKESHRNVVLLIERTCCCKGPSDQLVLRNEQVYFRGGGAWRRCRLTMA
jgi:hypothetical protein